METRILEYLRANNGPVETEEEVMAWWQGLQGVTESLDDLTMALERLEGRGTIAKEPRGKELFIYRIIAD